MHIEKSMISTEEVRQEDLAVEKLNAFLEKHDCIFRFERFCCGNWKRIRLYGSKLERQYWDNVLQIVNAFADKAKFFDKFDKFYKYKGYSPFKELECNSIDELLVKLDLMN